MEAKKNTTILDHYWASGFKPVRLSADAKRAIDTEWQKRDVGLEAIKEHVESGGNVGLQLGEVSDWHSCIDADCAEAVALAARFLPQTLTAGRGGQARHYFYRSPGLGYKTFHDGRDELLAIKASDNGRGHLVVVEPSKHPKKGRYRWHGGFNPAAIAEVPAQELKKRAELLAVAALIAHYLPPNGRHELALCLSGYLLRNGEKQPHVLAVLEAAWRYHNAPREALRDLEAIVRDTTEKLEHGEHVKGGRTLEELMPGMPKKIARFLGWERDDQREGRSRYECTDLGNAERLAHQHGRAVRYCYPFKSWYVFDGLRWARDESGEIMRRAKDTARSIFEEAARAGDDARAKELGKWALSSQSEARLKAMVELAQSEPGIPVKSVELDTDPFLFNVKNGTIDLRTGELREHRREDLITKIAPVEYDPDAKSELLEAVLTRSTKGKPGLLEFWQRWAGYCLTGDTGEEKLAFVHGDRATAKSTILEAMKAAWGDYATTADFEAFLSRQHVGGARNDIARLAGARLVVSIEVDEGKRLAEGLVKMLTGGDTVTARFLYQEPFEFEPAFKLTLAANNAPRVRDDDAAMWRRIMRVPFENVIPEDERDPEVKRALKDPDRTGPALLAWAVEGCLAWQREGLGVPDSVKEATEELRSEMDPLQGFIEDYCILSESVWAYAGELRRAYETWASESGETELVRGKKWGEKLRAYGCVPGMDPPTGKHRVWKGIGLRTGGPDEPHTRQNPTEREKAQNTRKPQENRDAPDGIDKQVRKLPSENTRVGGFTKNLSNPSGRGDSVGSGSVDPDPDPVCKKHHARACEECYRELDQLVDAGMKPRFAMEEIYLQEEAGVWREGA